ncbi:MAG TPA: amidohydrolase family protein, partial [Woeseiaceae bacterium]
MRAIIWLGLLLLAAALPAHSQADPPEILIRNVRIFDGLTPQLSGPTDVLVRANLIARIAPGQISPAARVIDGRGGTLMPGLIDVHVHMTFSSLTMMGLLDPGLTPAAAEAAAAAEAEKMLLRGFTAVRDVGGPVWSLKAGIDSDKYRGPRIWPSGPAISQTAGHGDMRLPNEPSRRFTGQVSRVEQLGAGFIADGRDEVLTAVRENLRFGASQLKLMAGGGTSSDYDPLDVTQYTLDELKAAVEAAEDWGTYVTVHAYHERSVRRAIEAGVRCIEHGQLLDEATLQLMADRGTWLSLQNLMADTPDM